MVNTVDREGQDCDELSVSIQGTRTLFQKSRGGVERTESELYFRKLSLAPVSKVERILNKVRDIEIPTGCWQWGLRREERSSLASCGAAGEQVEEEQASQVFLLTAYCRVEPGNPGSKKRIKKEGEFGLRHVKGT